MIDNLLSISLVIIAMGVSLSVLAALANRGKIKDKKETIEKRISNLNSSLRDATRLITHIQTEIETREKLADDLKNKLSNYNQIIKLKKPEVKAVAQVLRGEISREGKRTLLKNILINLALFVAGVLVTFLITKYFYNLTLK